MKQFLCIVAILCLVTTGCSTNRVIGPRGQRGGILTSQFAPRPNAQRGMSNSKVIPASYGGDCDPGCGCDLYCEPACGEPYCDPGCGCEDPGCGVYDPCCTDICTGDGCPIGNGNRGLFGKLAGRNGGSLGHGRGMVGGQACSACGDPRCSGCLGGAGFAHAIASGFCPHAGGYPEMPTFNPGPPSGQVAYPYYTTRGPRDFLQNNPPSIGPY